jgi:formylglycine-generating enzyme required for sulfatase activity
MCEEIFDAETPLHQVNVEPFYLDRTEVTNAAFEQFVRATGHKTLAERQEGGVVDVIEQEGGLVSTWAKGANWRSPEGPGSGAMPDHPAVQVSWSDAAAYCQWAGKRLPTEAEWEYAARYPDALTYPWGNHWAAKHARHADNRARGTSAPVGSYRSGASYLGILDLAGNVAEWTSSLYWPYPYDAKDGRESGQGAGLRAVRGGGWTVSYLTLRSAARKPLKPDYRSNTVGFRCARTAPPDDTGMTKSQ